MLNKFEATVALSTQQTEYVNENYLRNGDIRQSKEWNKKC